ncbi:hypothetical protein XA68_13880 [Ophiocordyceps unilateralis]|uniref:Cyanovirin-N domain-containing protein n=1 Tax=Ophiocordyceps unilateralis TaxID=268505 RepID=A0A2A9PBX2_OPHUN|nr:hypothetical protein XA68_13880 [Ophiocordyceps unilateralis]
MVFIQLVSAAVLAATVLANREGYGCIEGYIFYASSGECCSRDYVEVKREKDKVVKATCTLSSDFGLGRSIDQWPENLKGVEKCNYRNKAVASCPGGRWESAAALNPPETGRKLCCGPRFVRDLSNVCREFTIDFNDPSSSERYWEARLRDGCERKGERGWCCEDKNEFRGWDGRCTSRIYSSRLGLVPANRGEIIPRRRSDGCRDE